MGRIKETIAQGGSKVISSALSVVLAVGLMPLPAFAAELQPDASGNTLTTSDVTTKAGMSDENLLICAAFAANIFTPEMLGLSNPNYRDTSGKGEGETNRDSSEPGSLAAIFGDTNVNESVDPYVYNYAQSSETEHYTPYVCWGGRDSSNSASTSGNPMSALQPYDETTDSTALQNAVWQRLPQIILGTGSAKDDRATKKTMYQGTDYWDSDGKKLGALATALGKSANDLATYKPLGAVYNNTTLATLRDSVYYLAQYAQESLEADSTLKTRYSASPMEIAQDYERYMTGMKGYVQKAIDDKVVSKKTVALVSAYDSSSKTFTVDQTIGSAATTGNANRFLEGVLGVAKTYVDEHEGATTAKVDDLSNVDLIIVNGVNNDVVTALGAANLLGKTYYVTDASAGSTFMLTANSCEAAQLVGRILPCLYPELLDQSDMVAYWYDTFYHVKSSQLASVIDEQMDDTRNWAATDTGSYLKWSASDVSGYNHDAVENLLKTGTAYLETVQDTEGLSKYLKLSVDDNNDTRISSDPAAVSFQTITTTASASSSVACGKTLSLGAKTNGNGKLSYSSSDTSVATVSSSGVVTAKKVGTTTITVKASGTTTYGMAAKDVKVTVTQGDSTISLAPQSKTFTGSALAYSGKVTKTGSTGAVSYAYYSDAACKTAVAAANVKNAGTYYVKATVAANANYKSATSAAAKFTITAAPLSSAKVTLKKSSAAYTGKAQAGTVSSVVLGKTTLKSGTDYTVSATKGTKVGSYAVTVTGKGNYSGTTKATFQIAQASNTVKAAKTSMSKSYSANKKTKKLAKAQTIALPKVTATFGTAKWSVSTKDKKGVLSLKSSKVQVKKGAKKGTYTIKLKASVAKTANYKAATSKVVTVKVTVK